ncbi:Uncharacterised protein [Vibrio cholerae]|nr:Uncharacterised protein [Vibrio cholerae]
MDETSAPNPIQDEAASQCHDDASSSKLVAHEYLQEKTFLPRFDSSDG